MWLGNVNNFPEKKLPSIKMIIKIISYKEIFEKLVKKRLDDIKELTDEIKHDCLTHYFKDNTLKKDFMIPIIV